MELIKVAVVGIIGAIIAGMLKDWKSEFSIYVVLATGLGILIFILSTMQNIIIEFYTLVQRSGIDADIYTGVFRIIGIGYVTEYASEICRDSGSASISGKIELAGKVTIFVMSFPILEKLIQTIMSILGQAQ